MNTEPPDVNELLARLVEVQAKRRANWIMDYAPTSRFVEELHQAEIANLQQQIQEQLSAPTEKPPVKPNIFSRIFRRFLS